MNFLKTTYSATALPLMNPINAIPVVLPPVDIQHLIAWVWENYTTIMVVIGFLAIAKSHCMQWMYWLEAHFSVTIHLQHDETYDMVRTWIVRRNLDSCARSCAARIQPGPEYAGAKASKKQLSFRPWDSSVSFWFKGRRLSYRSTITTTDFGRQEYMSISCVGWSNAVLQRFLQDCRDEYVEGLKNRITIFENREKNWKKVTTRICRPLSTVIVNEGVKEDLMGDVKSFVSEQTHQWYSKQSMPYRRGYLLYGPPGTGKSSFSLSMAGELDLDIYVVNIPQATDESIKDLFSDLPEKCVVLLEDIDAAGANREAKDHVDAEGKMPKGLTLSGLLNTLDGVASQEGRIVIMTTNHIGRLDEALIRPGRVDKRVELGHADASMIKNLFMFAYSDESKSPTSSSEGSDVTQMANIFAKKIPEQKLSPAEIMGFLMNYRMSPQAAIDNVGQWVEALQEK